MKCRCMNLMRLEIRAPVPGIAGEYRYYFTCTQGHFIVLSQPEFEILEAVQNKRREDLKRQGKAANRNCPMSDIRKPRRGDEPPGPGILL